MMVLVEATHLILSWGQPGRPMTSLQLGKGGTEGQRHELWGPGHTPGWLEAVGLPLLGSPPKPDQTTWCIYGGTPSPRAGQLLGLQAAMK